MRAQAARLYTPVRLAPSCVYPERAEHAPAWHDRLADWLASRTLRALARGIVDPGRRLTRILPHAQAHTAQLRSAADQDLRLAAVELRRRLRREGYALPLIGRAFALVREVAQRRVGQRHFDVQLMGGYALLQGKLVEMHTGEGKTLTATLPAATAALAGIPVHVVTVNDYLARRDASAMAPIYDALGLTIGVVTQDMSADQRRAAYARDICYCTNKELAFDYLRDRVALRHIGSAAHAALDRLRGDSARTGPIVLRGLHYAIVDEADSVLIDEARTPLILAADQPDHDDAARCEAALALARAMQAGRDYTLDPIERSVDFTAIGRARLAELCARTTGVWTSARAGEALLRQALVALHVFTRDRDYIVNNGDVRIVDELTGRVMPDHAWERGLHQMIECKEGVAISAQRETLARITYQRLFGRYLRLAGMTGTAKAVAPELWSTYRLDVVELPLHRPSRRRHRPARLFLSAAEKWHAVAQAAAQVALVEWRAVLIGTRSVQASEALSLVLTRNGLPHAVLNAKQDREEARIIAGAGEPQRITVATNMAGRGTDIRLPASVVARGGLHVILTECHESSRIDRQLFGRCARQGDSGSCSIMVALDDDLFQTFAPWLARLAAVAGGYARHSSATLWLLRAAAQAAAERRNARIRADTLKLDRQLDQTLAFCGRRD